MHQVIETLEAENRQVRSSDYLKVLREDLWYPKRLNSLREPVASCYKSRLNLYGVLGLQPLLRP